MKRIYKTFRFAYETRFWISSLQSKYDEELQKEIANGLEVQTDTDFEEKNNALFKAIAFTFTLNITIGSILDKAIAETKDFSEKEWKALATEAEIQKNNIDNVKFKDATPSVYLRQTTYEELEKLQLKLRGDMPRLPKKTYIIKLAVFYLYKKEFC